MRNTLFGVSQEVMPYRIRQIYYNHFYTPHVFKDVNWGEKQSWKGKLFLSHFTNKETEAHLETAISPGLLENYPIAFPLDSAKGNLAPWLGLESY